MFVVANHRKGIRRERSCVPDEGVDDDAKAR